MKRQVTSRMLYFTLGGIATILALVVGAYLFINNGGVPMQTTATPLPLEKTIARMALRASYCSEAQRRDPLTANDGNLVNGAILYRENCAGCHGLPGRPAQAFAKSMFPPPPQLFQPKEMVTDDPEGVTFWKITNGIRLSGMPGFVGMLSEDQRWQLAMLLAHADKTPPSVRTALIQIK